MLEVEAAGLGFGRGAVGGRVNAVVRGVGADGGAGEEAPRFGETRAWGAVGRANSVVCGVGAVVDEGAGGKAPSKARADGLGAVGRGDVASLTAGEGAPRAAELGWSSGISTRIKGTA